MSIQPDFQARDGLRNRYFGTIFQFYHLLPADEPAGNPDRQTGLEILDLLRSLNRRQNLTIVMVTHDQTIAALADRTVRLVEGLVERVA